MCLIFGEYEKDRLPQRVYTPRACVWIRSLLWLLTRRTDRPFRRRLWRKHRTRKSACDWTAYRRNTTDENDVTVVRKTSSSNAYIGIIANTRLPIHDRALRCLYRYVYRLIVFLLNARCFELLVWKKSYENRAWTLRSFSCSSAYSSRSNVDFQAANCLSVFSVLKNSWFGTFVVSKSKQIFEMWFSVVFGVKITIRLWTLVESVKRQFQRETLGKRLVPVRFEEIVVLHGEENHSVYDRVRQTRCDGKSVQITTHEHNTTIIRTMKFASVFFLPPVLGCMLMGELGYMGHYAFINTHLFCKYS